MSVDTQVYVVETHIVWLLVLVMTNCSLGQEQDYKLIQVSFVTFLSHYWIPDDVKCHWSLSIAVCVNLDKPESRFVTGYLTMCDCSGGKISISK